jgi:hypothetical protein
LALCSYNLGIVCFGLTTTPKRLSSSVERLWLAVTRENPRAKQRPLLLRYQETRQRRRVLLGSCTSPAPRQRVQKQAFQARDDHWTLVQLDRLVD